MGKLIPVIGRRNEKKRILDSLNSDDISGVIIYGPPYVGKTLLLKSLAEEWIGQNGFHSVYCDVAKYDKLPVSELIKQLSAEIARDFQPTSVGAELPAHHNQVDQLHHLFSGLTSEKKVLVLFDSFESLPALRTDSALLNQQDQDEEADDMLTSDANSKEVQSADEGISAHEFLLQLLNSEHVKLIFGTSSIEPRRIFDLFPDHSNQIRTIRIGMLNREETEQLIQTEELDDLISWSNKAAIERVWQLTNGHPYLTKILAAAVSDSIFQDIGEIKNAIVVQPEMIDAAIRHVEDALDPLFGNWWNDFSEGGQLILVTIAEAYPQSVSVDRLQLVLNDFLLSNIVLNEKTNRSSDGFTGPNINLRDLLGKLQGMNVVESDQQSYRLSIKLFRKWILENTEIPENFAHLVQPTSLAITDRRPYSLQREYGPQMTSRYWPRNIGIGVLSVLLFGLLFFQFSDRFPSSGQLTEVVMNNRFWGASSNEEPAVPSATISNDETVNTDITANGLDANTSNVDVNMAVSAEISVVPLTQASTPVSQNIEPSTGQNAAQELASAGVVLSTSAQPDIESSTMSSQEPAQERSGEPFELLQEFFIESKVWSISISSDDLYFAAGLDNGEIFVGALPASGVADDAPRRLSGHTDSVYSLAFNPTVPNQLASASADGLIRLWNIETGETTAIFVGHTDAILSIAFSQDGFLLASGSADGSIKLWNVSNGSSHTLINGEEWILSLAFSDDGTKLAAGGTSGRIQVWDPKVRIRLYTLDSHTDWVTALAYAPSGTQLASGAHDKKALLWDPEERRSENLSMNALSESDEQLGAINTIAFHPTGKYLLVGYDDAKVAVWNLTSKNVLTTRSVHQDDVRGVTFSPDGLTAATGSLDGTVRLWEVNLE